MSTAFLRSFSESEEGLLCQGEGTAEDDDTGTIQHPTSGPMGRMNPSTPPLQTVLKLC